MNPFEVAITADHVFLYHRGVLIWKLARDKRSSYLFQTFPRSTELLSEG